MAYAARKSGMPGYVAVAADEARWKKDTAKTLAEWVQRGYTIERVTRGEAVAGLEEFAAARKALGGAAPMQAELLDSTGQTGISKRRESERAAYNLTMRANSQ